jgi:hypothetical protein
MIQETDQTLYWQVYRNHRDGAISKLKKENATQQQT